jgi:anthranilate phosphoribosyltransferase
MSRPSLDELGGWPAILGALTARRDLTHHEAHSALAVILTGDATVAQIAAFIVALRAKGETVTELRGLLEAMLDQAVLVKTELRDELVDLVGTGGDRTHSLNVSTTASFVVAGAGVKVGKHGSRAASSSTGAADLLEALGVRIELDPDDVRRCIEQAGMGFCFAQRFHPALRHTGPTRRELGIPTAFNVLGPLANPMRVRRHLIGVADWALAERMGEVLAEEQSIHAWIVQGADGLDELSLDGPSRVLELKDGATRSFTVTATDYGLSAAPVSALVGGVPEVNAAITRAVLAGERGAYRDIVVLNAAGGLIVAGAVDNLSDGVELAQAVIDDGRAAAVLARLVVASQAVEL